MRARMLTAMTEDLTGVCTAEEFDAAMAEAQSRSAALWEQHLWKVVSIYALVNLAVLLLTVAGGVGLYMLLGATNRAAGVLLFFLVGYVLWDGARAIRTRLLRTVLRV